MTLEADWDQLCCRLVFGKLFLLWCRIKKVEYYLIVLNGVFN